jgi:dynein light intermediate chain 1, cytosolic
VLDTDEEDILARLSIYMLSNPSAAFSLLLEPLFTRKSVPNTLITILLDWGDPFKWPRQLRQWIRVIRSVVGRLEDEVREVMEETMRGWKERRFGIDGGVGVARARAGTGGAETTVEPLGPGEWEDELGVPLSVVCLNAQKQEKMEKEYGWQEGDFDFVLQWMRCVLLKRE